MADRKAELEKKRERLKQIRDAKTKKGAAGVASGSSPSSVRKPLTESISAASSESGSHANEIDNLLKDFDLQSSVSSVTSAKDQSDRRSVSSDSKPTSPLASTRKPLKLSISHRDTTNIVPKELVQYTKETQTIEDAKPQVEDTPAIKQEFEIKKEPVDDDKEKVFKEEVPKMVELSDEAKSNILKSHDFAHFFDHAARIIEKAICEDDFAFDYGAVKDEGESDTLAAKKLALNRKFIDDRWSRHRCVTCMDWSVQHPELLVASYNQNEGATQDPDGVALIWNMKFNKQTPEYVFHHQSPIMSVCFAQFHPNLLIGGSYSGQIVLWDNRSRKRTPVQKTLLSAAAHTHPVYSVEVVGSQNAHNLISFSTDGKMCSWSLDMLSQPQEVMDLQHTHSKAVSVTSASFLHGDVINFVVGSEDGAVYSAIRHGSKIGISEQYEGHYGPVTAIDYNPVPGPIDFSHLFLTSSFDWTIRLWNNKDSKVLYSFEDSGDYVYDVQWSPIHPALFASVDGMGKLDLWNLNLDTEVPTTSVTIEASAAINRVKWSGNGHQLAAGDDDGYIYIYDIGEQFANPRPDEWNRLVNTLQEIQANSLTIGETSRPMSPTSTLASSLLSPSRM